MANRHKDFNKLVAEKFKNGKFAQAYIMNLVNKEGMSLEDALREAIISMGLQAFADKTGVSIQHISDFVRTKKRISTDTIKTYLYKAFNLKVRIHVESAGADVA